jgi:adenosylcobinamide-GDP ribazoletransferase
MNGRGHSGPFTGEFWREVALDTARCLRFYSRLPVPALPFETDPHAIPDFRTVVRMLPVAGALIGLTGGVVLGVAGAVGLPALVSSTLAIATLVLATGAFHEDGLADTCDGFGGGMTPARRLDIMTDSRIGTFGGAALVLSLMLRVTALGAIVTSQGWEPAAVAVVAIAAMARVAGLVPIWRLPNAKPDGKSAAVGRPGDGAMQTATILATAIGIVLLSPTFGPGPTLGAIAAMALVPWPMVRLSHRLIRGQTGDVAGAVTQIAEIAALLVLCAH